MQERRIVVADPAGLHARLAAMVVRLAHDLAAEITLGYAARWAEGRSLTALLALAVPAGAPLILRATGPDEALAVVVLGHALQHSSPFIPFSGAPTVAGCGRAFLLPEDAESAELPCHDVPNPTEEWAKLTAAIRRAKEELAALASWAETMGAGVAEMVRAQQEILEDGRLLERWHQAIHGRQCRALQSVDLLPDGLASKGAQETLLAVQQRLRRLLAGRADALAEVRGPIVLVGQHITEADLLGPQQRWLRGVVTGEAGCGAHVVALCEAWGIPLLAGWPAEALANVRPGDLLWVDGCRNRMEVNPAPERLAALEAEGECPHVPLAAPTRGSAAGPALWATLDDPSLAAKAVEVGAKGIGLVRTEWLYWNRPVPPDEEEQFQVYGTILAHAGGKMVTFRLADLRGAKLPPPLAGLPGLEEVWRVQLRALARLLARYPLRVTFPWRASWAAWEEARHLWLRAREEQGLPSDAESARGSLVAMVEHPALVPRLGAILPQVCGLALGTNDLMAQLAAHRGRGPGPLARLLRLARQMVELAHGQGVPVMACGQAAAEWPQALWLWSLGVDALSVPVARLPWLRAILARHTGDEVYNLGREILQALKGGEG